MQRLIDGYRRFRAQQWPERRAMFERLAHGGQSPRTMVIATPERTWPATTVICSGAAAHRQTLLAQP